MSRGPGRIQRAILAAIQADPDNAFTAEELCWRVYPDLQKLEKKHYVAVQRAVQNLLKRHAHLELRRWSHPVLFNRDNLISYATAWLKADPRHRDQPQDPRAEQLLSALAGRTGSTQLGAAYCDYRAIDSLQAYDDDGLILPHLVENDQNRAETLRAAFGGGMSGQPACNGEKFDATGKLGRLSDGADTPEEFNKGNLEGSTDRLLPP